MGQSLPNLCSKRKKGDDSTGIVGNPTYEGEVEAGQNPPQDNNHPRAKRGGLAHFFNRGPIPFLVLAVTAFGKTVQKHPIKSFAAAAGTAYGSGVGTGYGIWGQDDTHPALRGPSTEIPQITSAPVGAQNASSTTRRTTTRSPSRSNAPSNAPTCPTPAPATPAPVSPAPTSEAPTSNAPSSPSPTPAPTPEGNICQIRGSGDSIRVNITVGGGSLSSGDPEANVSENDVVVLQDGEPSNCNLDRKYGVSFIGDLIPGYNASAIIVASIRARVNETLCAYGISTPISTPPGTNGTIPVGFNPSIFKDQVGADGNTIPAPTGSPCDDVEATIISRNGNTFTALIRQNENGRRDRKSSSTEQSYSQQLYNYLFSASEPAAKPAATPKTTEQSNNSQQFSHYSFSASEPAATPETAEQSNNSQQLRNYSFSTAGPAADHTTSLLLNRATQEINNNVQISRM